MRGIIELRKLNEPIAKIAAVCGVSESHVSRWRSGTRTPSRAAAERLEAEWPAVRKEFWQYKRNCALSIEAETITQLKEHERLERVTPNNSFDLVKAAAREAIKLAEGC